MEQDEFSLSQDVFLIKKKSNCLIYFFAGLPAGFAAGFAPAFPVGFFFTTFFFLAASGFFAGKGFVPLTGLP